MHEAAPGWQVTRLDPGLLVRIVRAMPTLTPTVEAQVAAIWAEALAARPRLFNGTVFSADHIEAGRIEGHWTEYRRVLAQVRAPALFESLRIRSLAVNGLLACADGIVLGRRDTASVYQPGVWQSPPAGSVERRASGEADGVDLAAQLLAECEEELGLAAADVTVLRPTAAVEHPHSRIVDVGILLRTRLDFVAVRAAWLARGNREYDQLRLVSPNSVNNLGEVDGLALLPTTTTLIGSWRRAVASGEIAG